MALEVLLFDVDGTLADTERDGHRVAFNMAFADAGLDWAWSEELYGELLTVTGGKERIRYYLDNFNQAFERPAELDEFIAGLHKSKTGFYTTLLSEGRIPLRPGVERLLNEAREQGLRMAIATTTTPENVEALLVNTLGPDSESWFEVIAAGDIVPAKKPAPDIYSWAMEQMNVQPDVCMAFEDSYNGIRASRGASLPTLITVNDYTQDDDFNGAMAVLTDLGEPGSKMNVISGDKAMLEEKGYIDINVLKQLFDRH